MSDEYPLTLRRDNFAAIDSQLEFLAAQLARIPTRNDMARLVLLGTLATAALVLLVAILFR
jgi:hypothetical protein